MPLKIFPYDRNAVYFYAKEWAYKRNPAFYDFSALGGDCANYCSQCIFAGAPKQNYTKTFGWYYNNLNDRSPSFTGVNELYKFLTTNLGVGPFAEPCDLKDVKLGDVVQLGNADGNFYHSPIVTAIINGVVYVSAHSNDVFNKRLSSYGATVIRCAHILGYRKYE